MVEITCDMCGKQKAAGPSGPAKHSWILGYDIEAESRSGLSHSVRFLDRWDDRRILELGAIHLCSEKCRDNYLSRSRGAA